MVQKIKAIGFETPGDVSVLKNVQIEDPSVESQDVKIRVMAVSVNPGKHYVQSHAAQAMHCS